MRLKTHDEFVSQLFKINENIEILSQYQKDNIKVKCRCNKCGFEWFATPSNLLSGKGCKQCHYNNMHQNRMKSHDEFIYEMKDVHPEIEVLSQYNGRANKIKGMCKLHYEEGSMTAGHLLSGKTFCKQCARAKRIRKSSRTNLEFITELSLINPYIFPMEPYNGARNKIKVQCRKCGAVWEAAAGYLLSGNCHCTACSKEYSKGESHIAHYLTMANIDYEVHRSFCDLKGVGGKALTFDFYIPHQNILIEYQGAYHDGNANNQTQEQFERQKEHDRRKRAYAQSQGYNFYEIWYYDNIDQKLNEIFNENPVEITA